MAAVWIRMGVLAAVAVLPWPGLAGDTCIPDWSIAAPVVRKEGLVTVEQLSAMAKAELDGKIVKATLCEEKGSYVFRLLVRAAGGRLRSLTVDARRPFKR